MFLSYGKIALNYFYELSKRLFILLSHSSPFFLSFVLFYDGTVQGKFLDFTNFTRLFVSDTFLIALNKKIYRFFRHRSSITALCLDRYPSALENFDIPRVMCYIKTSDFCRICVVRGVIRYTVAEFLSKCFTKRLLKFWILDVAGVSKTSVNVSQKPRIRNYSCANLKHRKFVANYLTSSEITGHVVYFNSEKYINVSEGRNEKWLYRSIDIYVNDI